MSYIYILLGHVKSKDTTKALLSDTNNNIPHTHPSKHGGIRDTFESGVCVWTIETNDETVCLQVCERISSFLSSIFHTLAFTQQYPVFGQQMETETNRQTADLVSSQCQTSHSRSKRDNKGPSFMYCREVHPLSTSLFWGEQETIQFSTLYFVLLCILSCIKLL